MVKNPLKLLLAPVTAEPLVPGPFPLALSPRGPWKPRGQKEPEMHLAWLARHLKLFHITILILDFYFEILSSLSG